jgi:hypothetical protein
LACPILFFDYRHRANVILGSFDAIFLFSTSSGAKKTAIFDSDIIGVEKNRQISSSSSSETKKTVEYHPPLHLRRKKRMKLILYVIGEEKNGQIFHPSSSEQKKTVEFFKPLHRNREKRPVSSYLFIGTGKKGSRQTNRLPIFKLAQLNK